MGWIYWLVLGPLSVLMVMAALGLHSAACGMHVWAVDRMSNPEMRESYRGPFYRYCKVMAEPLKSLGIR